MLWKIGIYLIAYSFILFNIIVHFSLKNHYFEWILSPSSQYLNREGSRKQRWLFFPAILWGTSVPILAILVLCISKSQGENGSFSLGEEVMFFLKKLIDIIDQCRLHINIRTEFWDFLLDSLFWHHFFLCKLFKTWDQGQHSLVF